MTNAVETPTLKACPEIAQGSACAELKFSATSANRPLSQARFLARKNRAARHESARFPQIILQITNGLAEFILARRNRQVTAIKQVSQTSNWEASEMRKLHFEG
jgi:hypothetical protein